MSLKIKVSPTDLRNALDMTNKLNAINRDLQQYDWGRDSLRETTVVTNAISRQLVFSTTNKDELARIHEFFEGLLKARRDALVAALDDLGIEIED